MPKSFAVRLQVAVRIDCESMRMSEQAEHAPSNLVAGRQHLTKCSGRSLSLSERRGTSLPQVTRRVPVSVVAVAAIALIMASACARNPRPQPPTPQTRGPESTSTHFTVTAYCRGRITRAGTRVAAGVVAADPNVVPLGTMIRLAGLGPGYDGVYTVRDTGPKIRGRRIDLYLVNCDEAVRFGRRAGRVSVVR
jgi:3D (Asp-Asp-Asp) domain-containing protein